MKTPIKFSFAGGIFTLIALTVAVFVALAYLTIRTERINTAICIPIQTGENRLYFSAPRGRYVARGIIPTGGSPPTTTNSFSPIAEVHSQEAAEVAEVQFVAREMGRKGIVPDCRF